MGFFSFLGRVLFASLFILSAWQMYNEFGVDGGSAAKEVAPKLVVVQRFITSKFGEGGPKIDVRHFIVASIVLKGLGGILFVFGSSFGAYLLLYHLLYTTPLLCDFYNYSYAQTYSLTCEIWSTKLVPFHLWQCLALFGALLFFIGMKNSIPRKQHKKKAPKTKTV
ncbi:hypothetical protein RJ639_002015 [Escallonia herrerae]|uniref:Uncharacterized protein n=1 Tax=Escallonia herrerae TaxID=1293975 RepID=A0AA88XC17_9ASTE|nr:hypothetical protein RJ639_002015 [Escallonia herrerae]